MLKAIAVLAAVVGRCSATYLYVSSYAGNVTTLSLTESCGQYTLETIAQNPGCAPNPTWLTLDVPHNTLYCLNEGLTTPNGSITSFSLAADGSLSLLYQQPTLSGPVNSVIVGRSPHRAIALAEYGGGAVSTYAISDSSNGTLYPLQNITFSLAPPGPNAARQDASHAHEAILDPTGQYILVPDLGADLVRVFSIDSTTDELYAHTPLSVVPGSGPRHAAFYSPSGLECENCTLYLYVVTELGNTVTGYQVTYPASGGLAFTEVYATNTYGGGPVPPGNAAAEVHVTPDNRFLVVSNRNNSYFSIANPDPNNSTNILSDSLATYGLMADGSLAFEQLAPAGGSYPRQFSINAAGNLIAVGLQYSSTVVILERNVEIGTISGIVAFADVLGQITCVMWDESQYQA